MSSDSDVQSVVSSSESSDGDIENMILDQPMYYVLNQFLVTDDGKNIATCIDNLSKDIVRLTKELSDIKRVISDKLEH